MAKKRVLIVDPDPRSSRLLEVSLRAAGYHVAVSTRATDASRLLDELRPNLILCDTHLSDLSGFDFLNSLRHQQTWKDVPFVFLSNDDSLESKLHGLEIGAEEYLAKPIYVREVITRVGLILKRRENASSLEGTDQTRFSGQLTEMGLVDLLQTMELNRKSGALGLVSSHGKAAFYFRDGTMIDAHLEGRTLGLKGVAALYRAFTWNEGRFEMHFRRVRRNDQINQPLQALVLEGLRRLDEWNMLLATVPPLDAYCEIHVDTLRDKSNLLPDDYTRILRHVDGKTTLRQILDTAVDPRRLEPNQDPWDDLAALRLIAHLFHERVLIDTHARAPRWLVAEDENVANVANDSENPPAAPTAEARAPTPKESSTEFRFAATLVPAKGQVVDMGSVPVRVEPRKNDAVHKEATPLHTIGFENLAPQVTSQIAPQSENHELTFFQRAERDSNRAAKEHAALQELVRSGEATVVPDPLGQTRRPHRRIVKNVIAAVLAATTIAVSVVAMPRIVERWNRIAPKKPSSTVQMNAQPSRAPHEPMTSAPEQEATTTVAPKPSATPPSTQTTAPSQTAPAPQKTLPAQPSPSGSTAQPKPAATTTAAVTAWKDLRKQALRALDRGQDSTAEQLARQALATEPTQAEAWLVLGAALDSQGHHGDAQNAYVSCVKQGVGSEVAECRRLVRKK